MAVTRGLSNHSATSINIVLEIGLFRMLLTYINVIYITTLHKVCVCNHI